MMGLVFFLLMFGLFFLALFFITLNLIFIIIWSVKKRKGKTPKKRYLVIPITFSIISLLVVLMPICWISAVRSGNKSNSKDIVTAESGKIVYWGHGSDGDETAQNFEMDGTTYVGILYSSSSDTWKLGKPVANIRAKSTEEGLNKIMGILTARDDTSTLYPVINENGFDLYTIESTITTGLTIYCPINQNDSVLAYYKDISHEVLVN